MEKYAIVCDSTSDIPADLIEKWHIYVVPLYIDIDENSYRDRIDISNEEFYEYIATAKELPKTSQPSLANLIDTFRLCKEEGATKILFLHIPAEMSGTGQGAAIAADMIKDEVDVEIIDCKTVTMGAGLLVTSLAEYIHNHPNIEWDELQAHIEKIKENMQLYFILDSLDNLQKGGRIGKASYLIGSVLSIKPILEVKDGWIRPYEKIRSHKPEKAIDRIADIIISKIDPEKELHIVLGYNNEDAYRERLEERLKEKLDMNAIAKFQIGNVVTTHIGLGAVGAAFYQL